MKPLRLGLILATGAIAGLVAANPRRSSARYEIVPETVDGGGGRSTSANYELVVSLSPGGNASSNRFLAGLGYAAQLSSTITGPCREFLDWSGAYFPNGGDADSLPENDHDRDGIPNVIEFAFNLDPTTPDNAGLTPGTGHRGLPAIRTESVDGQSRLTIEFIRRRNSCAAYSIEASTALASWAPVPATQIAAPAAVDAEYERVKFADSVPAAPGLPRFLRVRVTLP